MTRAGSDFGLRWLCPPPGWRERTLVPWLRGSSLEGTGIPIPCAALRSAGGSASLVSTHPFAPLPSLSRARRKFWVAVRVLSTVGSGFRSWSCFCFYGLR